MHMPIGEFIRQIRRQRGLTQTELGKPQFSKSYVSAVERGQIIPSYSALRFFALQLDRPAEELESLLEQTQTHKTTLTSMSFREQPDERINDQDATFLLNLILQGKGPDTLSLSTAVLDIPLDPTMNALLQKQARAALLKGLLAQEQADLSSAQTQLEFSLALAADEYKSVILDALGNNAYLLGSYEQALHYYLRALDSVELLPLPQSDLVFQIELHCGHVLRLLGQHQTAQHHYARARKYLRPTHNMNIAGQLYLGLGYSTYAALYQTGDKIEALITQMPPEKIEAQFQQTLSFLLQSRTLYQVGADWNGEVQARLTQAVVLLDLCDWRQQQVLLRRLEPQQPVQIHAGTLLDEVYEQCHQILVYLQELYQSSPALSAEQENIAYMALAYLIRSFSKRATIARLGGYESSALQECSLAAALCQLVLHSLEDRSLSWTMLDEVIKLSSQNASSTGPSTLYLPPIVDIKEKTPGYLLALAELYFAAGEVTEERASSITNPNSLEEAYSSADECFTASITAISRHYRLARAGTGNPETTYEPGYTLRFYQRYLVILKQREQSAPIASHVSSQQIQNLLTKATILYPRPLHHFLTHPMSGENLNL
ncbi:hypothetical protein KDW_55500 [Dictyobacter vulcani]|uniref:HTH cro/C1-type domain-containing protein n=1 Tax=Dictyobacter vulcani TaxID=2607529 RepID=A0A5J4KNS6_9CHLR|nr:transcriptional regulator [Dictyobacter vulcani]GER91388.1 hypothetical protein KDW_55500 [Dictyobacter vulcani]